MRFRSAGGAGTYDELRYVMILVVDDHPDTRSALLRLLGYEGYQALAASSGAEALAMLVNTTPALIILDYDMHGMNGLEFLAEMRHTNRLRNIPVIMYSAELQDATRDRALAAGVAAYVKKASLDWAQLRHEVTRLIGLGNSQGTWPDICDTRGRDSA